MVSLRPVTQFSSKMRVVVSLVTSRITCTHHEHIDPFRAPTDAHRDDLIRKRRPIRVHGDTARAAFSGVTSISDPVFK